MNNLNKLPSAFSLFKPSTNVVKGNIINVILLILPYIIMPAGLMITFGTDVFNIDSFIINEGLVQKNSILYIPLAVLLAVLTSLIANMAILWSSQNKKFTANELLSEGVRLMPRLLAMSLSIGILVLLGFILWIIPGIFMMKRYYLAVYFLIDQDLPIRDAMSASAKVSKQYSGAIWGLIGIALLFTYLELLPGVGLVLGILYAAAPAIRYNQLKELMSANRVHSSEEPISQGPISSDGPTPLAPAN